MIANQSCTPNCNQSNSDVIANHADLCFEKSEVEATITTPVISIKNPRSGQIKVPSVGEIIMDDGKAEGEVVVEE